MKNLEVVSQLNKLQRVLCLIENQDIDLLINRLFILTTITGCNIFFGQICQIIFCTMMNKRFSCACAYVPVVVCVCAYAQTVGFPLESFPQHLTTSSSFFFWSVNFIPIGLQPANGSAAATAKVVGTVGVTGRKQEVREVLRTACRLSLSLVRRRRRCR